MLFIIRKYEWNYHKDSDMVLTYNKMPSNVNAADTAQGNYKNGTKLWWAK